jgi:hypothetical protein
MLGQFSAELIGKAWVRSQGHCECKGKSHGHYGRCDTLLAKPFRGEKDNDLGWEAHSVSGLYLDDLSDIEILCWKPCYRVKLEAAGILANHNERTLSL